MTKIDCGALLFDLDGVLIDSTPAVERVWSSWASERGFDPEETVRRAHGRPSITTVRELLPNADHERENREVERREIEDVKGVVPLPGVLDLLHKLPSDRWTIVTSCTRPLAIVRIKAAGLPLPKMLTCSTDAKNGKPAPDPYLAGAAALGVPASDCVVIEDAPAGILAGKAAQARVIGFRTTQSDAPLREAGADWIVDDCSAIEAQINNGRIVLTLQDA